MVVALARKLLIALWRFCETGLVTTSADSHDREDRTHPVQPDAAATGAGWRVAVVSTGHKMPHDLPPSDLYEDHCCQGVVFALPSTALVRSPPEEQIGVR